MSSSHLDWRVLADTDEVARAAAEEFISIAASKPGPVYVALAGGSTPERLYRLLAAPPYVDRIDWPRIEFFLGDERCVPPDDERSNFHMINRSLLASEKPRTASMHRIRGESGAAAECAQLYDQELRDSFKASPPRAWPQFDLILLGLGDDGHTASLFPHATALKVDNTIATSSPPGVLPPPVDRVTFTFPVLNAARNVMFLVTGANKAAAAKDIYEGRATVDDRPASGVRPADGRVLWLLDQAAASGIRLEA